MIGPNEAELDELDRALLIAVQAGPVLAWSVLSEIIGVSRSTAQKRWKELGKAHGARVSVHVATSSFSAPHRIVELKVKPGTVIRAAEELGRLAGVYYVAVLSGPQRLFAHFVGSEDDMPFVDIEEAVGGIPEVTEMSTRYVTHTLRRPTQWRIEPINAREEEIAARAQKEQLDRQVFDRQALSLNHPIATAALLKQLQTNARVPVRVLNNVENRAREKAGLEPVSVATTSRERARIFQDPAWLPRLEVPAWSQACPGQMFQFLGIIAPTQRRALVAALGRFQEMIYYSMEVTGRQNLVVWVYVKTSSEFDRIRLMLLEVGASGLSVEKVVAVTWGQATSHSFNIGRSHFFDA